MRRLGQNKRKRWVDEVVGGWRDDIESKRNASLMHENKDKAKREGHEQMSDASMKM